MMQKRCTISSIAPLLTSVLAVSVLNKKWANRSFCRGIHFYQEYPWMPSYWRNPYAPSIRVEEPMLSIVATFFNADRRSGASLPMCCQIPLNVSISAMILSISGVIFSISMSNMLPYPFFDPYIPKKELKKVVVFCHLKKWHVLMCFWPLLCLVQH